MALDYGSKRVGVASTDETGHFALPRMVLANNEELLEKVLEFKMKEGIDEIVMGESHNLDGTPNAIMKEIENFKNQLEEKGMQVVLHPEVFSTMEARQIQGNNELTDASAAAIILKSFLDSNGNQV